MEKLEASEAQARTIIEDARADARKHLQAEETRLLEEIAVTRREREDKRQAIYEKTLNTAEEELVGVREEALRRVPDLTKKVMVLFMPGSGTPS